MPYTVGIEIAGSQTRAVLLDTAREPDPRSPDACFHTVTGVAWDENDIGPGALNTRRQIEKAREVTEKIAQKAGIKLEHIEGVGVAVVPAIDFNSRMIPPNERLGQVSAIELGRPLRAEFRTFLPNLRTLHLHNRSQFGAWAEMNYGVAQRYALRKTHMVYLTISYYIDAGIVIDSKLYLGGQGIAGQYSHLLVAPDSQDEPCSLCSLRGCLWAMGSGLAMLKSVKSAVESGNSAAIDNIMNRRNAESMLEIDRGGLMRMESAAIGKKWIDARAVVEAAQEENDPQSKEAIRQAAIYIGRAVAQIINGLNPHLVVLGGVAANGNFISDIATEEARQHALTTATRECDIVPSAIGDMAALLGAAVAARLDSPFDPPAA